MPGQNCRATRTANSELKKRVQPFLDEVSECAPKLAADREHRRQNEHLDAYLSVSGIQGLFSELERRGALVIKPLEERPWASLDFYVEDPGGYILCFSEQTSMIKDKSRAEAV